MKQRFEICIPRVLKHEGGYVDHPRDPGGATNMGITISTFRRYIKPSGTKADLKAMTEAQAVIVYKRHYWDTVSADSLPAGVDMAVFDFSVNSGPSRAAKYLQKVVGAVPDGRVGPATIGAVEAWGASATINELCDDRLAFMKRLGTWKTFGRGWTKRVERVRQEALGDVWETKSPGPKPKVADPRPDLPATAPSWLSKMFDKLAAFFSRSDDK